MYKKLAVGISICSGATATVIPLVLMWLGYKTPLKLVLWLYLLLISISLVFCLASLCYVKKDKQATILFMVNALYNLTILTNSISDAGAVYHLWRIG